MFRYVKLLLSHAFKRFVLKNNNDAIVLRTKINFKFNNHFSSFSESQLNSRMFYRKHASIKFKAKL